jgi:WD40 repeat protein
VSNDGNAVESHGSYARSVVRVLDAAGTVAGAGFLVSPYAVATCAHVVSDALDGDPYGGPPTGPVVVDFPMSRTPGGPAWRAFARVTRWAPIGEDGTGDVALLRLETPPPPGARVPPMRGGRDLWDHEFRVFGFPAGMTDGVWATGRIRDTQGTGWLQLQGAATDQGIDEGYSGSPVWDATAGAVVGMTVARDRDRATTTAYVVPIAEVLGLDPDLLPCPYRGPAPFDEEYAAFFHGRDEDVARLVAAAGRRPVVAVAGRSGVGKSSLVRAGLLPVLRREGATIVECPPGGGAVASLATALAGPLDLDPVSLKERLARSPEARRELVERARGPVVLLLDQFEETITADPEGARDLLTLVVSLVTAAETRPYPLRVVLTLRWESLGSLLTPDLAAMFEDSTVFVTAMSRGGLREAIVRPAEYAPGLHFEDGLVERILDDAGTEPGRLPLVESLLAELWERRGGGSLTLRDYEALGGVNGALVQLADRSVTDSEPARRLLTRLARPDGDDFVRQPVAFDSLDPALQEAARRLAAGRLVVLGSAPDGTATVELAHQALIEHWPRLREWLVEDRDFLSWRHQAEAWYQQWRAAGQDAGALLRGTALAAALDWMRTRAADVTAEVAGYVRLSRRRQRRDVRRWRVVTAALAVLVVAAGTLAGVAVDRGEHLRRQRDAAGAEVLGQRATQRASTDPVTATQLALAAYGTAPANLTARTALAREYLAMRSVDAVFPGLAPAAIAGMAVSDDGRTAVTAGGDTITVITGLAGGAPARRWNPPGMPGGATVRLSPDGRRLAATGKGGSVLVWDLTRRTGPETMPTPGTLFAFSPDGRRLAWLDGGHLTVRDLDRGTDGERTVAPATNLALTGDPDQVVLGHGHTLTVSGGRELPHGSVLAAHGTEAVTCVKADDALGRALMTVTAVDTGRRIRRIRLLSSTCPTGAEQTPMGNGFLVEDVDQPEGGAALVKVTELRTGRAYTASTPPRAGTTVAVFHGVTAPVLLVAQGGSMLRVGRMSPDWFGSLPGGWTADPATGERYVVARPLARPDEVDVYDRGSGARLGRLTLPGARGFALERSMLQVTRQKTGVRLSLYSMPALRLEAAYDLPLPGDTTPDPDVIAQGGNGRFAVVADGVLAVWDSRTHQMIGTPTRLGPSVARSEFRPGHDGQVAVADGDGSVRLWDDTSRRVVTTMRVDAAYGPVFDATGDRIAAIDRQHIVRVWRVGSDRPEGPGIPVSKIIGFTSDGYLAVSPDQKVVTFVNIHSGQADDPLVLPGFDNNQTIKERSLRLGTVDSIEPVAVPVDAVRWFDGLCTAADRPFTATERALLPPGSKASRPCHRAGTRSGR